MEVVFTFRLRVLLLIICTTNNVFSDDLVLENEANYQEPLTSNPGLIYSKQTGLSGDSLIVGTRIRDGNKRMYTSDRSNHFLYSCKERDLSYYNFTELSIWNRTSRSFEVKGGELIQSMRESDYFLHINKEVWDCHDYYERGFSFVRIVNELISIREIREIKYCEGIEVTMVNYDGNGWRTKIKEIRYMAKYDGPYEPLRYQYDKLILEKYDSAKRIYNSLEYVKTFSEKYDIDQKDLKFREDENKENKVAVDTEGKTFKIGGSWTKNRTHSITGYKCKKALGMHPLPRRFQPEVYQLIVDEQNPDSKIYGRITEPQLSHFFTLAKSTVWHCTSENQENEGLEFYRVVNEMIGTERIREVVYEDSVVGLSVINQTDFGENIKSVRFTDIGLFYTHSGERLTKEVNYTLVHRELTKSSVVNGAELGVDALEFTYALTPTSVYRTLLNPTGYDIRVGSKVSFYIGRPDDKSTCKKQPQNTIKFNTVFKIKVEDGGVWHSTEMVKEQTNNYYFKPIKSESWLCEGVGYSFYRVINKIRVIIPVRFIETYDGIQILQKPIDDDEVETELEITELKYLYSRGAKRAIMYVGRIDFGENFMEDRKSYIPDIKAVRKSEEETTHWLGVAEDIHFPLKDYQISSGQNQKLKINAGTNRLNFPVTQDNTGDASDIVECSLVHDRENHFYPGFNVENATGTELKPGNLANFENDTTYFSFFKNDFHELWLCECPEKGYKFYRVLTRQSLKEDTGIDIGEVNYWKRDQVWIEMKNDDKYEVQMKQIRYLNNTINPISKTINYDGYVVFEESRTKGVWNSGTEEMGTLGSDLRKRKKSEIRTLQYSLDRKRLGIHKFTGTYNGQPRNESLLIGSQWQEVIGNESDIYRCTKRDTFEENLRSQDREKFRTNIIRTEQVGFTGSVLDYFDFKLITTWTCIDQEKEFTRVVNHFTTATDFNRVKQVQYYDGVTILRRESVLEIIEVKYLNESTNRVLKYLGKLKFPQTSNEGIKPLSFTTGTVYKKSTEYNILISNEVYKTYVGHRGSIVEIGEKINQFLTTFGLISCEEDTSLSNIYLPKVVIVKKSKTSIGSLERKEIINNDLKNYFVIEQKFWKCKAAGLEYTRVHNKLKLKSGKSLSTIYHFAGVTVTVDGTEVEIEEVKYTIEITGRLEVFKYDGLVHLAGNEAQTYQGEIREFGYLLDTELINFRISSDPGLVLEVGSIPQGAIEMDDNVIPECRQLKEHGYNEAWSTVIKNLTFSKEEKVFELKSVKPRDVFESVEQELWLCDKDKNTMFYRVVERLIWSQKISSMYYYDGVSIQNSKFTDHTVQQISEVKFLTQLEEPVVFKKYAGMLRLQSETDVVVDKLFPQPIPGDRIQRVWPLNSLMHLALLKLKEAERNPSKFRTFTFTDVQVHTKRQFQTTIVNRGLGVVQIGTFWEDQIQSSTGEMRCILDDVSKIYGMRYVPKVVELIGNKAYVLGEDDFLEMFKVKKVEVWLCSNKKDNIIRVVSQLEGKVPFFAIRHTDAVTLEIDANTHKVNANETIYINALNSKVVKYDGAISSVHEAPQGRKTTSGRIKSYLSGAFSCTGAGCRTVD